MAIKNDEKVMKIELEAQDIQAIAEKEMVMNRRATGRAQFQAQGLYSLDRQGHTEAHWMLNAMKCTVQV